jgi:hypothetical protein
MKDILIKYITTLYDLFIYDIEVMSQPWMYWCLLVPITCYVIFFVIKWSLLTAPIWLPVYFALNGIVDIKNKIIYRKK